ncbi:hypothetical protein QFZ23_002781 [Arthrobacter globiformis]|nr:hypothetical protein [Arthrobacter globiformis]
MRRPTWKIVLVALITITASFVAAAGIAWVALNF